MAADQQAEKPAEEQTQQPAVPTGEQKVPDEAQVQEAAPKEEAIGDEAKSDLPEGVKERTKTQFEKLKDKVANWKDRATRAEARLAQPPPKPAPQPEKIWDKDTGLVNVEALEKLQQRTIAAEKKAQELEGKFGTYVTGAQEREAYGAHPELRPGKGHDKDLHVQTRRIAMDSMVYPETYGGAPLTMKEAADLAKKTIGKKETPKERDERTTVKEQASLGATGRPGQGIARQTSEEDYQAQREATRHGDKDAVIARMKAFREASEKK